MDKSDHDHPKQVIEARQGSTIQNVIQAIIHLPAWAWVVGTVVLAVSFVLAAAMFNVGPLRQLLPTPMAFATAASDQSLIIVADFDDRSGANSTPVDPAQYVYEQLVRQVQQDNLNLRVERLRQVVDDTTAKPVGQTYNATLVVWGWYDALTITPRIARIKTLDGSVSDQEGLRLSMADPEEVEFSVVTDLPSQTSYLVMFTLAIDKYSNNNFSDALPYFENALLAVSTNPGISTNPSESYFFRANIYLSQDAYDYAIADFSKAIELEPNDSEAYNNRGVAYGQKGE